MTPALTRRRFHGALLAAAASPAARAAPGTAPLRIGLIASYSGPYADYGRQFDAGMAVLLAQQGERLAGRRVEIVRRDTAGPNPQLARRFAQELVTRERVAVLAGFDFSPNAYAAAPVATQAGVPMLVMNAAASGLTAASPFALRFSFTVPQVSAPMATWMLRQGLREAFVLVADYAPGLDAESAFTRAFTAGGGRVAGTVRVPLATLDFAPYLQRIAEAKPPAVFFFLPSGTLPQALLKGWQERGLARSGIRLLATGEATDDSYLDATGDAALGLVTSHHYSFAHDSARNRRFVAEFAAQQGSRLRPGYFAVAAYDALAALGTALGRTGGATAAPALVAALQGLQWESPRGPVEIDAATRDIVQTVYLRRTERVDGRLVNVEFDRIARVPATGLAAA